MVPVITPLQLSVVVGTVALAEHCAVTSAKVGVAGGVTSSITVPDPALSHTPNGATTSVQVAPDSSIHDAEHPSPAIIFASSHCSPVLIALFPHPSATVTDPVTVEQFPAVSQVVTDTGVVHPDNGVVAVQRNVPELVQV